MPRIDPLSLLKCLSVLLGPNGGIKSKEEVIRLANLMTKFSKKLVSKCIYIQILKSTDSELLNQFMGAGGWNLMHMWLTDGILAKNWALIQELLELLLLCPVDIERLKSNHCPKLIKGLSKEGSHQGVRTLASRLVEQWLKMVKGEAIPNTESQVATIPTSLNSSLSQNSIGHSFQSSANVISATSQSIESENALTIQSNDCQNVQNSLTHSLQAQPQAAKNSFSKTQSQTVVSSNDKPQIVSSVYKITIRDGKQVLTQVQTDVANISAISLNNLNNELNGDIDQVYSGDDEISKSIENSDNVIERTFSDNAITTNEVSKNTSSEVKDKTVNSHNIDETDHMRNKVRKNEKDVSSNNKSTSDKENRDKKDDKKSVNTSSDKKSSSHSQSSKSSSNKHSSSSSKHSSSKHSSSSHRSSSKSSSSSSSSSRDKSSREKEKDRHYSSSSSKSSSSKSKSEREKEKEREREKLKKEQAEKDKATLEKIQNQTLSTKIGKIPKKKVEEDKSEDSSKKSSMDSKDISKENKDKLDPKKITAPAEKKKISISIESRKTSQDSTSRPKTVKTFNSKFRSTGLEEEVKPPLPRGTKKSVAVPDKKVVPPKLPLKRTSPIKETGPTDKKAKLTLDSPTTPPSEEKKGGIKLIPAKPKLIFLQESDMFMDALTASTKSKEPRKRKRRTSISKDGPTDPKKSESGHENNRDNGSPPGSPGSPTLQANKDTDDKLALKPTFKFYQDTLETDEDKEDKNKEKADDDDQKESDEVSDDSKKTKKEEDEEDENDRSRTPTPENDFDDVKSAESPEDPAAAVSEALKKTEQATLESKPIGVLRSVLQIQKRKGPKKSLKWKTELESIRYFELDETERVNVTKTFTDMKQMEKMNEREAFQMARKLSSEDVMEEKTLWKPLIPIDLPPPLVESGKDSREKDVQYAREKGILQALYFHRGMIPDSAAEPDEERHHIFIDPKTIPLDDLTGNKDSEKDFSSTPWPEPKPQLPASSNPISSTFFPTFRSNQQQMMPPMGAQPQIVPMPPIMNTMPPQMAPDMTNTMQPPPTGGGGGWRTGDGKIVVPDPGITPMPNMPNNYSQGMEGGPMGPSNMMGPPMYNQDGYMVASDEMNYNSFQGPPPSGMYGPPGPGGPPPPGGPPGPPFQGPRGPPMHGNRGRGGPGWFRGGPPRGMPWRGGWRGNGKPPPVCRQFSKNGFCRVGDKCQFLHPGVNYPPF